MRSLTNSETGIGTNHESATGRDCLWFWSWRSPSGWVFIGVGVIDPTALSNREDRDPTGGNSGNIPQGFGPIPLANAPDENPVPPPRPGAEGASGEMRKLAARMSRETGDLKVVTHPDGRRSVSLEGRFLHMSAVVTGADGKPEVRCFTDFQQMAAALPGGPPVDSPRPATHAR